MHKIANVFPSFCEECVLLKSSGEGKIPGISFHLYNNKIVHIVHYMAYHVAKVF